MLSLQNFRFSAVTCPFSRTSSLKSYIVPWNCARAHFPEQKRLAHHKTWMEIKIYFDQKASSVFCVFLLSEKIANYNVFFSVPRSSHRKYVKRAFLADLFVNCSNFLATVGKLSLVHCRGRLRLDLSCGQLALWELIFWSKIRCWNTDLKQ